MSCSFSPSDRLAASSPEVSHFDILPVPAHTAIVKACLGILLQSDNDAGRANAKSSYLANYAARHWVDHARFEKVSTQREGGMRRLLDPTRLYFEAWLNFHDIDGWWYAFGGYGAKPRGSPLYYASLCGFRNLAAHLADGHPKDINSTLGRCLRPLVAALHKRHFDIAELLYQRGADVGAMGYNNRTPFHAALMDGFVDIVEWLVVHGADAMSPLDGRDIPLHLAIKSRQFQFAQMLLRHGITVHSKNMDNRTSLHLASDAGQVEMAQLILQHGADIDVRDQSHSTPLHLASRSQVSDKMRSSRSSTRLM